MQCFYHLNIVNTQADIQDTVQLKNSLWIQQS